MVFAKENIQELDKISPNKVNNIRYLAVEDDCQRNFKNVSISKGEFT